MFGYKKMFEVYQQTKALGEVAIASEYTMVIDGEEGITYAIKKFPVPYIAPEDKIEVPMVGGLKGFTSQAMKFDFSGAIEFKETADGIVFNLLHRLQADLRVGKRPRFNATVYYGMPDEYLQKIRIIDALLHSFDPIDADFESRGQIVTVPGQISGMYFPGVD